jgi:hypothetical protein
MGLVDFALWRFRNAEGVMSYVKSWNMTECVLDVNGKIVKITYHPDEETATIQDNDIYSMPVETSFKNFKDTLTRLGYYKERPIETRHMCSYKEYPY